MTFDELKKLGLGDLVRISKWSPRWPQGKAKYDYLVGTTVHRTDMQGLPGAFTVVPGGKISVEGCEIPVEDLEYVGWMDGDQLLEGMREEVMGRLIELTSHGKIKWSTDDKLNLRYDAKSWHVFFANSKLYINSNSTTTESYQVLSSYVNAEFRELYKLASESLMASRPAAMKSVLQVALDNLRDPFTVSDEDQDEDQGAV